MKALRLSEDIVTVGEFRAKTSSWLEKLKSSNQPVVITQNGKPAAVLLSPAEYDKIQYTQSFMESVARGTADADVGRVVSTEELERRLEEKRKARGHNSK